MSPRSRTEVGLVLGVYVLPLLLVSAALWAAGLGGLALALLGVEAVVAGATAYVGRRRRAAPVPAAARPAASPWPVLLGMAGVVVAVVVVAALAGR